MWNIFKVNNKDTRTTPLALLWCLYCLLWTYFSLYSCVFMVIFERVIAGWDNCAMFHHFRISVTDFRKWGFFCTSHPWAALKKPILNRVNWLPVLFSSVIRFCLILNPHFMQLVNNYLSFDSYTSNALSSLRDLAPGDDGQTKFSKSLSD